MGKQLKPCPLCGNDIGVQIITAVNCNGKVYRGICWGDTCRHKLPSAWYEKRKEAIEAWNNIKSDDITSIDCDYEKKQNKLAQKATKEIVDVIIKQNEFDKTFLQNKIYDIIMDNFEKLLS